MKYRIVKKWDAFFREPVYCVQIPVLFGLIWITRAKSWYSERTAERYYLESRECKPEILKVVDTNAKV